MYSVLRSVEPKKKTHHWPVQGLEGEDATFRSHIVGVPGHDNFDNIASQRVRGQDDFANVAWVQSARGQDDLAKVALVSLHGGLSVSEEL